jgi:hypothetical protein
MYVCRNDHEIRGPMDRLPDDSCRHCDHARQARWRAKKRAEVEFAKWVMEPAIFDAIMEKLAEPPSTWSGDD